MAVNDITTIETCSSRLTLGKKRKHMELAWSGNG